MRDVIHASGIASCNAQRRGNGLLRQFTPVLRRASYFLFFTGCSELAIFQNGAGGVAENTANT